MILTIVKINVSTLSTIDVCLVKNPNTRPIKIILEDDINYCKDKCFHIFQYGYMFDLKFIFHY